MALSPEERRQCGRLTGYAEQVRYPVGTSDFLYRLANLDGTFSAEEHGLRLLVTSDECRQLARHLDMLAAKIEAMGGTKQ
jgi:hypothetical protein